MKSLNIGVLAYGIDRSAVMVRVPNERGRWLLTDRCVVEVDCPTCGAITGEPCRRGGSRYLRAIPGRPIVPEEIQYGIGVHISRKSAASERHGGGHYAKRLPPHKLRIRADDLAQLQTPVQDGEP